MSKKRDMVRHTLRKYGGLNLFVPEVTDRLTDEIVRIYEGPQTVEKEIKSNTDKKTTVDVKSEVKKSKITEKKKPSKPTTVPSKSPKTNKSKRGLLNKMIGNK